MDVIIRVESEDVMQTFLPYPSFTMSAKVLDNRRLGKQRVEAFQIYKVLKNLPTKTGRIYKGWRNHPAVKMWDGYEDTLLCYMNCMISEWISRGFNNTMQIYRAEKLVLPKWVGMESFHSAHRSNLLRKDYNHYSKFGWKEPIDLEYVWPKQEATS